jgi:CheY-like chemotaxis protein
MEAVGQLAGGIAHDFNNLLAVITGNLELAEGRTGDNEVRNTIRKALNAVEAGAQFNRRLLALARRRELRPVRLVLNRRVEETTQLLRRTLGEHIAISMDLAPDLWPTYADSGEIDSALLNLAVNARDAMPKGGELIIKTRNIVLDAKAARLHPDAHPGEHVQLSVADTGTGMAPEVLQRAMEPFYTTKEPGKGTGLGLSSVFGFAKQSGGFVALASRLGNGTTVNLHLPRAAPESATEEARASSSDVIGGRGELILVVEDNDAVRNVTLKRLQVLGYAAIEARTGAEAIELLKSRDTIALVFSDIVMPGGITGHGLARWVLATKPHVKVLLTSGYDPGARNDGEPAANVKTLTKPYVLAELARSIRQALGHPVAQVGPPPVNT